jgi:lysophospholipase L1-like esterase
MLDMETARLIEFFLFMAIMTYDGCPSEFCRFARSFSRLSQRQAIGFIFSGLLVILTALYPNTGLAAPNLVNGWMVTWSASPQPQAAAQEFNNQTLRLIVHSTTGGTQVRIRISNTYGTQPLLIGDAHIAIVGTAPAIVSGSDQPLTFGGQQTVTIPVGASILSDPLNYQVPPLTDLAVSLYLPNDTATTTLTEHYFAQQTSYVSSAGDFAASPSFAGSTPVYSWFFLTAVDVSSFWPGGSIVVLGDSLTDGEGSTFNANNRWPDLLAARLQNYLPLVTMALANQGITGNRILKDGVAQNALARFDRDVLSQASVNYLIVQEGINDIGYGFLDPLQTVSSNDIIQGLIQLIQRAREQRIEVYGATLTPFQGSFYYSTAGETERQSVNQFIRSSGAFDAVLDFDQVLRDPNNPTQLLSAFDSGDHLHPNAAGHQAIAQSINPSLFFGFVRKF